jgi:hypothetical protein
MEAKNCKISSDTTPIPNQTKIDMKYGEPGDTGAPTEVPTDNEQGTGTPSGEIFSTGRLELWNTLISNYKKRDDKGNPIYPFIVKSGNRIKYKGMEVSDEDLSKLDSVMDNKGYSRIKQESEKGYGTKYVWEKRKK